MIKLIASDLDGTLLLNGSQTINEEMFDIIRELRKRDILFVAASGRQYPNIKRLFKPVDQEMAFVCENGALVMYQDKVILKNALGRELGIEIAEDILRVKECEVVLSGVNTCYLQPKTEEFLDFIADEMENNCSIVEQLVEVKEELLKVSMYAKDGVEGELATHFMNRWGEKAKIAIAGFEWLDFNGITANKGHAIKKLQEVFGVKREESMAFGDNYNDVEMLESVHYNYAMKNAKEVIKDICNFSTDKVEDTLLELLKTL